MTTPQHNSIKAFGYLRVSGLTQVDGDGFPRQRAAIEAFAERNNIEITEWFLEEGVSGTTELDDRPALGRLFAALEANGVKTIVCEKIDRLARDLMISETIIGEIQRRGFTLVSTCEPDLCSREPMRVFIRQVFGALAQLDRATITARMAEAKRRKRDQQSPSYDPAWHDGRKPYGTRAGEREILEQMRAMRSEGAPFQLITDTLNGEGKLARGTEKKGAQPWSVGAVHKILSR